MKIRFMSDLHGEIELLSLPVAQNEKDDVLVLAGDIGVIKNCTSYLPFISDMSDRFNHVLYVLGNHEYWRGNFSTAISKLRNNLNHLGNVTVLEDSNVTIEDVTFIGSTLWTDMDRHNEYTKYIAGLWMNDYKYIRHGPSAIPWQRKLQTIDTIIKHERSKRYIFDALETMTGKVVVITHHSPCSLSQPDNLKTSNLAGAYHSLLAKQIIQLDNQPKLWIHGHLHNSSDYMVDSTRVVCNPRGYVGEENEEFDPLLTINI